MGGIVRFTDLCSGHDCWPPRIGVTFSPNVFVNNLPVERLSDELEIHCCPDKGCHNGIYIGSHNVKVNNLDIQVQGDPISCGSTCTTSSTNTIVN